MTIKIFLFYNSILSLNLVSGVCMCSDLVDLSFFTRGRRRMMAPHLAARRVATSSYSKIVVILWSRHDERGGVTLAIVDMRR
jgi:hypothetical protein